MLFLYNTNPPKKVRVRCTLSDRQILFLTDQDRLFAKHQRQPLADDHNQHKPGLTSNADEDTAKAFLSGLAVVNMVAKEQL